MELREFALKSCIQMPHDTALAEALVLLDNKGLDYCLVISGTGGITGYASRQMLAENISKDGRGVKGLLEGCARPFESIYTPGTLLDDVSLTDRMPFLVHETETDCCAVIDLDVIFSSLANFHGQKDRLAKELDVILDFSDDEIYIIDGRGVTLLANKAFEENSGIPVEKVLGRNVVDLEKEGFFKPSIGRMVLEEKRQITTLQQYYDSDKRHLVTGTPVFDSGGAISRVIINTRDTNKLNMLKAQLEEIELLKDRYCQELIESNQFQAGQIVAKSSTMNRMLETARKLAEVDATVSLLGESGVGKSLLARYIHDNSGRKNQPFITISCGAIPENLLESELFGYEGGAFTGANPRGKIGKIELANKGTLFLDEIGDLPLPLQSKLLHVIQEGVLTRLGGNREIRPDVRYITATNKVLSEMVREGLFREDLYYRLNIVPLELPPLRQRKEDIETLALKFIEVFNKKYSKRKSLSSDVQLYFKNYSWPGNVRELENLVERLVIVVNEDIIGVESLPESIRMENIAQDVLKKNANQRITPLERIKEDLEKQILERLYREHGNTYKMAGLLQVNQSTVVRKLKKYNISRRIKDPKSD